MSRIHEAMTRLAREPEASDRVTDADPTVISITTYPPEEPRVNGGGAEPASIRPVQPPPRVAAVAGGTPSQDTGRIDLAVPAGRAEGPDDAETLIDIQQIIDYLGFTGRAVLRRKLLATAVLVTTMAATAAAVHYMPRTYEVQARLLVQRDIMAALGNPGRAIPPDADSPQRAVAETVLRYDNLVALLRQTDMLNDWERDRIPLLRLKDKIFRYIQGDLTPDEKLEGLVGLLEDRLKVYTGDPGTEGTVLIELQWPNAQQAYELVDAAVQNFLQARKATESSAIAESVSILESYAEAIEKEVNATAAELSAAQAKRPRAPMVAAPSFRPGAIAAAVALPSLNLPSAHTAELERLRSLLELKRQDITKLEEARRQQVSELQSRLNTALTIYTEGHPTIASLRQGLESASNEPPQLVAARMEARELERAFDLAVVKLQAEQEKAEIAQRSAAILQAGAKPPARGASNRTDASGDATAIAPPQAEPAPTYAVVDETNPTSLRLRLQLNQLSSIRSRIDGANIELATSQAGFKYRYTIIRPPQMPRGPIMPNVPMVLAAGLLGSMFLAIAVTAASDVFGGRIIEAWQLQRQVGIPVLATVKDL